MLSGLPGAGPSFPLSDSTGPGIKKDGEKTGPLIPPFFAVGGLCPGILILGLVRLVLLGYLIYGNILIALAAVSLTRVTTMKADMGLPLPLLVAVFTGTFFTYNLQRLLRIHLGYTRRSNGDEWLLSHWRPWIGLNFSLLPVLFFLLFLLPPRDFWVLIPCGAVIAGYSFPFIKRERKTYALRDLPFLKVFLIAAIWTAVTVGLPWVHQGLPIDQELGFISLERFSFILALTIPFDIRDLPHDDPDKHTMPQVFGIRGAKGVSMGAFGLSLLTASFHLIPNGLPGLFWGYFFSVLPAAVLSLLADPEKKDPYYAGWIDGMMILQFLMIGLFGLF